MKCFAELFYQYERREILVSNFREMEKKFMKKPLVEVSVNAAKQSELGNRWKDGKTIVILTPLLPVGGFWDTKRGSDIDSAGGSDHAFYECSYTGNIIWLKTGGYEGDTLVKTHLTLNDFESMTIGASGGGTFNFRQKELDVSWEIIDLE